MINHVFFPVPIVQKTVGKYAKHIVYYSETEDPSIPTENIGVPNTERGQLCCNFERFNLKEIGRYALIGKVR